MATSAHADDADPDDHVYDTDVEPVALPLSSMLIDDVDHVKECDDQVHHVGEEYFPKDLDLVLVPEDVKKRFDELSGEYF